ncbi:MAG: aminoacyl-tRNA hydrolase [Gammaproteobacteria bacterium]|nr:aminoacyl-tRNA hydrolase [Gammaproteobacteria bacterium]
MYFPNHTAVPRKALTWQFSQSSGPGGQHTNKVATAVTLRIAIDELHINRETRERLLALVPEKNQATRTIILKASSQRSQWRNRIDAWNQLLDLLTTASQTRKVRHRTKPTLASKRRRKEKKQRHSAIKAQRGRPILD